MHLGCHVHSHVISHSSTSHLGEPAPRAWSHPGISPGREILANWPSLGTVTQLPVEHDKYERLSTRVGPQDRGEKDRRGHAGEGKGPRQGTREAVSVHRQKARLRTPLPRKSPRSLLSESTSYPHRRTEAARMVTSLGQSAPALDSKTSSSLPTPGAAEPKKQTGPPPCVPGAWLCRPSLHFAASPTDAPSIF